MPMVTCHRAVTACNRCGERCLRWSAAIPSAARANSTSNFASPTPPPLPGTLSEALTLLQASETAAEWFQNLDESEICRRYAEVY
jgi:hypothetical protein